METLKNLYGLYDKVRNGDKNVYDALRALGVGMETKVSYDDTQESFISAVIQSPLKESFDELIKSSLANLGEKEFNSVVNRFLISSSEPNTGVVKEERESFSTSLFQKAFEGGQPWAVQEVYELYYYSKSQEPSLNVPVPTIKEISKWLHSPLVNPDNTGEILKTVFSQNYVKFSELTNTSRKIKGYMFDAPEFIENVRPVILNLISLDDKIENIEDRVEAIEKKYSDFDINTVYGKSQSILVDFILNDKLRIIPELNKKLGLDMNRNFNEDESLAVTSHFNVLLNEANQVAAVENETDLNKLLFSKLLDGRQIPYKDFASPKILNINETFDRENPIKNFYEYISALDNLKIHATQESKDLLTELSQTKTRIPVLEKLNDLKEQTTILMMVGDVQPPRTKNPSLR